MAHIINDIRVAFPTFAESYGYINRLVPYTQVESSLSLLCVTMSTAMLHKQMAHLKPHLVFLVNDINWRIIFKYMLQTRNIFSDSCHMEWCIAML